MINSYSNYQKTYYEKLKNQEELYLKRFSDQEIELSNGQVLKVCGDDTFDQNIVEDILDYNRRTKNEKYYR